MYDLTTENHHFAAGIGNIIVHNTDSIYVKFFTEFTGQEHMNEVFRISEMPCPEGGVGQRWWCWAFAKTFADNLRF